MVCSILLVEDDAILAENIQTYLELRNFGAVSYTHLTLPTTPYV